MGSITLTPDPRFPPGTVLNAYDADGSGRPIRPTVIASATVGTISTTFPDLDAGRYAAGETVAGPFVAFVIEGVDPAAQETDEFADTFEPMKIIGLSNGNVLAIPLDADPPAAPTGLTVTPKLSSVTVNWTIAARASRYVVYRSPGGTLTEQVLGASYRDLAITVGQTYQYWVQAVDTYGQRSAIVGPVTAFVDPADNVPPEVDAAIYPAVPPTGGKSLVRVLVDDPNGQTLTPSLTLTAGGGTLTATEDPTVFVYTAP